LILSAKNTHDKINDLPKHEKQVIANKKSERKPTIDQSQKG